MKQHPSTLSFQHQLDSILRKEPNILLKVQKATQLPPETAKSGLLEVLKFLSLIHFTDSKLTPSHTVDLIWHELILFTRLYCDYCEEQFGRYIHHHPGGKQEENHRQFRKTIQLYILYIGAPPITFWGSLAEEMYASSQCGTDI